MKDKFRKSLALLLTLVISLLFTACQAWASVERGETGEPVEETTPAPGQGEPLKRIYGPGTDEADLTQEDRQRAEELAERFSNSTGEKPDMIDTGESDSVGVGVVIGEEKIMGIMDTLPDGGTQYTRYAEDGSKTVVAFDGKGYLVKFEQYDMNGNLIEQ